MYLVAKSFYAKLLAVLRVSTNKGGNTPGVDNTVWTNGEEKLEADIKACFNKKFPRWKNKKVNFIRYADDFVTTAISKEVIAKECKQITTFMSNKKSNYSRVTLGRVSF